MGGASPGARRRPCYRCRVAASNSRVLGSRDALLFHSLPASQRGRCGLRVDAATVVPLGRFHAVPTWCELWKAGAALWRFLGATPANQGNYFRKNVRFQRTPLKASAMSVNDPNETSPMHDFCSAHRLPERLQARLRGHRVEAAGPAFTS